MINLFLKYKTRNLNHRLDISLSEIENSKRVLFSLFTRYGDTVISLIEIRSFIKKYPKKDYLILCPKQMQPYVEEILPSIKSLSFNKRNPWSMFDVVRFLKKWKPDIGFNPWSNGLDSCYFLTFSKNFKCYRHFQRPKAINHYEVVRSYLNLPILDWQVNKLELKDNYYNILICPHSTDPDRELKEYQFKQILSKLKLKYPHAKITIASMSSSHFQNRYQHFKFEKQIDSSRNFLKLIKGCDLVISSDSGPLHIASALNKDLIAYFSSTLPEIVLRSGVTLKIERNG